MSSQEFYVSHEGQQMGPYPLDTILKMVKNGELNILDYLYDQGKEDWVLLMEYPALEKTLKDHKPASAPQSTNSPSLRQTVHDDSKTDPVIDSSVDLSATKPAHLLVEWYILKGENKFGPFSYADVIKMLQNKVAFEFDFVWHSGLANWVRIADHDAFQPEQISQMKNASMPDISEVFFVDVIDGFDLAGPFWFMTIRVFGRELELKLVREELAW